MTRRLPGCARRADAGVTRAHLTAAGEQHRHHPVYVRPRSPSTHLLPLLTAAAATSSLELGSAHATGRRLRQAVGAPNLSVRRTGWLSGRAPAKFERVMKAAGGLSVMHHHFTSGEGAGQYRSTRQLKSSRSAMTDVNVIVCTHMRDYLPGVTTSPRHLRASQLSWPQDPVLSLSR